MSCEIILNKVERLSDMFLDVHVDEAAQEDI